MAKSDLKIARKYAPHWFYGGSKGCLVPKEENLEDLGFEDAINVVSVTFYANSDIVHIELK